MYNLFGIRIRIEHQTLNTVFSQFADDIDDFGIPDIADVFLESQAEHEHSRALDRLADPDQLFNGICGDNLQPAFLPRPKFQAKIKSQARSWRGSYEALRPRLTHLTLQ